MSLAGLPSELLIEIVEYFRPDNTSKPITGLNAAWKQLTTPMASESESEHEQASESVDEKESGSKSVRTLSHYASLYALASTCSLFKELCSPLIYENFNIVHLVISFDDFYLNVVVPNVAHFRHIRIDMDFVTDAEAARILQLCRKAKSLALYGGFFIETGFHDSDNEELEDEDVVTDGVATMTMELGQKAKSVALYGGSSSETDFPISDSEKLDASIVKLFEEARLDTLGVYEGQLIGKYADPTSPLSLLRRLSQSVKGRAALKRLDLSLTNADPELSYLVRTSFPSLESLTCFGFLDRLHPDIWNPSGEYNWAKYTNLTRLQFRDGGSIYASQVSSLVRHFPSLLHLMVSCCDDRDHYENNFRPEGWYDREDALWRVRKPLETLQLEFMADDEITLMGDIPTKTLIVVNFRGNRLTEPLLRYPNLFPGLQRIRIMSPEVPDQGNGYHPFDESTLRDLVEVCGKRKIALTRDAEVTRLIFG